MTYINLMGITTSNMDESDLRDSSIEPIYRIDPGFINYRKCFSVFGSIFLQAFNKFSKNEGDHLSKLHNDHLMVTLALKACSMTNTQSLFALLHNPTIGKIFSSTQSVYGRNEVYNNKRAKILIHLPFKYDKKIYLEFGTEHFVCDTGKVELSRRSNVSIIGELHNISEDEIIIHPLIMGAPTLDYPEDKEIESLLWLYGTNWYQCFIDEIDEFKVVKTIDDPPRCKWADYMKKLPEKKVKDILCDVLNEIPAKDWGGEQEDIYTSSLHLNGKRLEAAFLLKGPSKFKEMTIDMLGDRADQLYRLSCTPAKLLIVQHCHQIGRAVRATLQAFAETPSNPRRYCFIDGKDTYKLLKALNRL